jgi:VanZ family protein
LIVKRALGLWLPVAACMALLLVLSGNASLGQASLGWDKLNHVAAYLVLGLLCLVEVYQANIPDRHGSVLDGVADLVGACAAVVVLALWVGRRTGARPNWKET